MKKILIAIIVTSGLSLCIFSFQKVHAFTYSTLGTCNSPDDDSTFFPYRFLCGSDNNDTTHTYIRTLPTEGINDSDPTTGNSFNNPILISPRASLSFELGFTASGIPRNTAGGSSAPVLVWAYILGAKSLYSSYDAATDTYNPSSVTGLSAGGAANYCPGDGGSFVPAILNYNRAGPNISPAGYTGNDSINWWPNPPQAATQGYEDCGNHGLMAYWNDVSGINAGTTTNFRFTINLKSNSTQPFCVRENIAVSYAGTTIGSSGVFSGNNSIASHVAKQSEIRCYQMSQPKGTLTISCPNRTYSLTGYDPLNPTGAVSYRVTNGLTTTYFSGSTRRTPPTNGTFSFVANRTYHLEILNSAGQWIEVDSVNTGPCGSATVTGQCTHVDINDDGLYTLPTDGLVYPSRSWAAVYEVETGRLLDSGKAGRQQARPNMTDRRPFAAGVNVDTLRLGPYTPLSAHIVVQTDREYYNGSAWVDQLEPQHSLGTGGYTCYSGSCNILGVTNAIDGSPTVIAGQPYYFTVQLNNDNPDPAGLDFPDVLAGAPLSLTDMASGSPVPNPTGGGVLKGTSGIFYIFGTAPDVGGPTFISTDPYPDFYGFPIDLQLGPRCGPVFVPVYYPFSLAPHTLLSETPTDEAPTNILYQAWVSNPMAFAIPAPAHARFTVQPGGNIAPPVDSAGPWAPGDNYIYNANQPVVPNAGDHYCIDLSMDYTTGLAGPLGDVINAANPARDFHCFTVNNKPYFRAVNGSVRAGGDFEGTSCTGGGILGGWYNNNTGSPYGSGSSLSILALLKSSGVASGIGTSTPPPLAATAGSALSFANRNATTATPNVGLESPLLGGNYAPNHCMPKATVPPTASNIAGNTLTNANNGAFTHTGNLMLQLNSSVPIGTNTSVHVTGGDVYIRNNVTYTASSLLAPWLVSSTTNTNNIPSFTLIVDGGNIYVDPSVTQLDGLYIAAKSGATGGKIYTCGQFNNANSFVAMPATSLFGGCNQQLVINGAFVANQVNLMRTFGSLRDDQHPGINCSNAANAPSFNSCAGEIFRFSPELFLSNQPLQPPGNGAVQYDALASLPPVL